jgi:hypothetical protein
MQNHAKIKFYSYFSEIQSDGVQQLLISNLSLSTIPGRLWNEAENTANWF